MKKTKTIYLLTLLVFLESCSNFDAETIGKNFMQQYEAKGVLFLQDTNVFTERCVKKSSNVPGCTKSFDNLYRNFIKDSIDFNFDYEFVENGIDKNSNTDDIYPYYKIVVINTTKRYFFLNIIKEQNTYYINSFYFPQL